MTRTTLSVDDPYTGEIIFETALADREAVRGVLARAQEAQRGWARVSVDDRVKAVRRFVERFRARSEVYARELTAAVGKPVRQSRAEIRTMLDRADELAGLAPSALAPHTLPDKDGYLRFITHEPAGVVVVLAAWNYPLLTAIGPVVAAVLAGNAVVIKHSNRTPRMAEQIAEAMAEAGVPPHLVTALAMTHDTVAYLVQHEATGYVSFTGSVAGGRAVYRAIAEKKFIDAGLELGGKDPAYVRADCNFDFTVENVVDGALYNAGQSCCAVERVYVEAPLYARFVDAVVAEVEKIRLKDPRSEESDQGPMAQASAPGFIAAQVEDARSRGARVLTGGRPVAVDGQGRFFLPTVVADTDTRMALEREETFGPVLVVAPVSSDDEAVARMNASRYGLTASVWSTDVPRARDILSRLEAGTVFLNRADFLDPLLAWTGRKDSGKGVSLSHLGFRSVTRPKSYHLRLP